MPSQLSPSEWQTRKALIDPKLRAAGWEVVPYKLATPITAYDRCAVEEYPTENGPADYALVSGDRVVGIVEAKRVSSAPQEVLTQAERYARGLSHNPFDFRGLRTPFLYSTNGEVLWHHDVRHRLNRSREIVHFHTPAALEEKLARDFAAACEQLANLPNDHPWLRPYQFEANAATEKAIAERKRHMLIAMATGTGKTFNAVNLAYRLMKTGIAKRILFLVDRRALAAQAVQAFHSFEAEPGKKFHQLYEVYSQRFRREDLEGGTFDPSVLPSSYLTDPNPVHTFVYVSTIQRMTINLFGHAAAFSPGDESPEHGAGKLDIPIHAFDLVIADECHRGYTSSELNVWRSTLEHFDAIKVGLTATPAAHTTSYFKNVVYRYPYEQAVADGFLVDYDVVAVKSDVRLNGIFLAEGEQVDVVDPASGAKQLDLLEDEREFPTSEVEAKVTSPDSNRRILAELKKYADEHQGQTGRFPKTLIFAANDLPHTSHSDQLVDLARDLFGRGDDFVQKITGRVDRPLQRIREFRNRKDPGIVVTVDMLSTGVDIPDLEFIVFLRPVKSRILFEQMMGRGTRKSDPINKAHFVVFDCFDGTLLEYFRSATAITAEVPERQARTFAQIIDDIYENRDRDYNVRVLVKRLQRIDKRMSGEARKLFARYLPEGDVAAYASSLPERLADDFNGTMKILRDPDFQRLLVNYPRPKRTFWIASAYEDDVSSSWLLRDGAGREVKPEDYLEAFNRFVRDNADSVEAISILLRRPSDWSTDVLVDLKDTLQTSGRFDVEDLRRAHALHYKKALVDIISMIKHASSEEEPLLSINERVSRALDRITADRDFSPDQLVWLDYIGHHLAAVPAISEKDFSRMPVLENRGGWGKANQVFDGRLSDLLLQLNEALAA